MVYADWLEERGDPQAELIRTQCELARRSATAERTSELESREFEWLLEYGDRWLGALRRLGVQDVTYQRGLIEHIEIAADDLVSHATEIFQIAPTIRRLQVSWASCFAWQLAELQELDLVDSFDLHYCDLSDEHLHILAPRLSHMRRIDLSANAISDAGVRELIETSSGRLQSLNLQRNRLRATGASELVTSPNMARVESLNLGHNNLGIADMPLISAPPVASLRSLDLGYNGLDRAQLWELFAPFPTPALTELNLSGNFLGVSGVRALVQSSFMGQLAKLDLSHCNVGDEGMAILSESNQVRSLRSLTLVGNSISDAGVLHLASTMRFSELESLDLSQNQFGDRGAVNLLYSPALRSIRSLFLCNTGISSSMRRELQSRFGDGVWF